MVYHSISACLISISHKPPLIENIGDEIHHHLQCTNITFDRLRKGIFGNQIRQQGSLPSNLILKPGPLQLTSWDTRKISATFPTNQNHLISPADILSTEVLVTASELLWEVISLTYAQKFPKTDTIPGSFTGRDYQVGREQDSRIHSKPLWRKATCRPTCPITAQTGEEVFATLLRNLNPGIGGIPSTH